MALGIVEIVEEDCETNDCIDFIVSSEKFAQSIVGKYYKDPNEIMSWTVLDLPTSKSFINKRILLRSPMTCQTADFKICRKCFGGREFPTENVGVCAGQIVSERLTQLIMRLW